MGLTAVKPLLTALVLPPVPWLLLVLLGAWHLRRRPWLGWLAIVSAVLLTWFSWTPLGAVAVTQALLKPPPPLRDLKTLVARPPAAGQTVPHLHVHLIPRYNGDLADPRGGVRWIFPERADYWSARGGEPV